MTDIIKIDLVSKKYLNDVKPVRLLNYSVSKDMIIKAKQF